MPSEFIPEGFISDDCLSRENNLKTIISDNQSDITGSERSSTPKSDLGSDYDDCSLSASGRSDSGRGSELNSSVSDDVLDELAALSIDEAIADADTSVHVSDVRVEDAASPAHISVPSALDRYQPCEAGPPVLVSYADGSNTFTLLGQQICVHDITVSCVVDACHVFLTQMKKNPTREGLQPLEEAMTKLFAEEAATPLLKPIAKGSVLAVASDGKFYRCQVEDYNSANDTCDIKFVDHGGYTTVAASELRQLSPEFIQLPFQALEVYLAGIHPATEDEAIIDIVSDMLFRRSVSIQVLGFAENGIPVVQAYFFYGLEGQYIQLLTQEVVDQAYRVFLHHHPNHIAVRPNEVEWCLSTTDSPADLDDFAEQEVNHSTTPEPKQSGAAAFNAEFPTLQQSHPQHYHQPTPPQSPVKQQEESPSIAATPVAPNFAPAIAAAPLPVVYYVSPVSPGVPQSGDVPCVYAPIVAPLYTTATGPDGSISYVPLVPATHIPVFPAVSSHPESESRSQEESYNVKPYEDWSQEDYENYYEV